MEEPQKKKPGRPFGSKSRLPYKRLPKAKKGRPAIPLNKQLNQTQLGLALGKSRVYVSVMFRAGFNRDKGIYWRKGSVKEAQQWLLDNQSWFRYDIYKELPKLDEQKEFQRIIDEQERINHKRE